MPYRKLNTGQLKKGCTAWTKRLAVPRESSATQEVRPVVRMGLEEFSLVTKTCLDGSALSTPDCEGRSGDVCALRPLPAATSTADLKRITCCEGTRLVDSERMITTFNEATDYHNRVSPACKYGHLKIENEVKYGLGWKVTLQCQECGIRTPQYRLYKEVKTERPGPNPAAVNIGLGIGLQDTPMGNTRARTLLANLDVPPPARSSMQRISNRVAKQVTQLNQIEMAEKVQLVKAINKKRGHKEEEINIAMDGRYNSTTISSRKKPGQNASQAIGQACETMADRKYIINACFQNKLCWTGAWLRGQGMEVTCPGGHSDCTASLPPFAPLSELEMGRDIGSQLSLQGLLIKYVTTDGDSRSARGVDETLKVLQPMWEVQRLADPGHLGQSQFRQCQRAKFRDVMFGCKTRETTRAAHTVFNQDVKARCSMVLKKLMERFAGDKPALRTVLPSVLRATLNCYDGDCSHCSRYALVCSGHASSSWWTRSMFLATDKITSLSMDENDKHLLREILKMKLGVEMVEQMKLYTDTQKCEASNRSLSVLLPKNVNYSRNMAGRASSTIHRINNGPGTSTISKCAAAGIELSPRVRKSLRQMDSEAKYQQDYQNKPVVVKRRLLQHGSRIAGHLKYKRTHKTQSDYRKGQLDTVPASSDHTYSK